MELEGDKKDVEKFCCWYVCGGVGVFLCVEVYVLCICLRKPAGQQSLHVIL